MLALIGRQRQVGGVREPHDPHLNATNLVRGYYILLESNWVVELVWCHERSAGRRIGLARDHAGARFTGDALFAQVTRDHRLANKRHGFEQELDDVVLRPRPERLRPIESRAG